MLTTNNSQKGPAVIDLAAYREWMKLPRDVREIYLHNAYCPKCRMTSFARDYVIRKDFFGLVIEGTCKKCGAAIARTLD